MTTFAPGDRVIVYSFGEHPGEVIGPDEQHSASGWVAVRLDNPRHRGRIWRGHVDHLKPEPVTAIELGSDSA
jgi:hypothetical protein